MKTHTTIKDLAAAAFNAAMNESDGPIQIECFQCSAESMNQIAEDCPTLMRDAMSAFERENGHLPDGGNPEHGCEVAVNIVLMLGLHAEMTMHYVRNNEQMPAKASFIRNLFAPCIEEHFPNYPY